MSRTKQYSSLLTYINDTDPDFAEVIENLGIHRLFVPRRNSTGITFLHPSKKTAKELYLHIEKDENTAIEYIKSLIITEYVKNLKDFANKPLTTLAGYKIQAQYNDAYATLNNGSRITKNPRLSFATDINVYEIDGLVPIDGEKMQRQEIKSASKIKNCDVDRSIFFESVLDAHYAEMNRKTQRNPALEVLLAIIKYLELNESDTNTIELVKSFVMYDTLTALALIIQPYFVGVKYIDDHTFADFATEYSNSYASYSIVKNPFEEFVKIVNECRAKYTKLITFINAERDIIREDCTKKTINVLLNTFYEKIAKHPDTPVKRRNTLLHLRESELIVMGTLIWEYEPTCRDLKALYRSKCTLNSVYQITPDNIKNANLAFYFSSVLMVLRSVALFHVPGFDETRYVPLNSDLITNDEYCVSLSNKQSVPRGDPNYYKAQYDRIKKQLDGPQQMPYVVSPKQLSKTQKAQRDASIAEEKSKIDQSDF
jgi:hypothetical protein